ncbi:MAG: hypothetical protein LBV74_14180 [Tannerella sp.]|jgi:hypothetical protein|nr:hypothetical protein [Tannerella sp.]
MTEKEETIQKLKTFGKRRHRQSAFIDVDLDIYQKYVDLCINELITEIERNDSPGRKKNILKKYLSYIRKMQIGETVEREYVCMEFYDLSQIVSIDVGFYVNKTLYGSFLAILSFDIP